MLNRAALPWQPDADDQPWSALQVDRYPVTRLIVLLALTVLPLGGVAWRVARLQIELPETYAAAFEQTTEKLEPIPTTNGRIIAGGEVLAEDEILFGVKVHYRWLEQPPNADWVRQQARSHLTRAERRKPERVATEIERVKTLHEALWQRIAALADADPADLNRRRARIQKSVERIHRTVAERLQARHDLASGAPPDSPSTVALTGASASSGKESGSLHPPLAGQSNAEATWWQRAWDVAARALTTPPQRDADEPLVIQEELDYHPLLEEISLEMAAEIEAHPELYPGLRIAVATRRNYPHGPLASHVIGHRARVDEKELKARRERFPQGDPLDYQTGDWIGKTGIEGYYERHLRGLRGVRKLITNRRGEVLSTEIVRHPRPGRDLELALHPALQQESERLLDAALKGTISTSSADIPATTEPSVEPVPLGGCIVVLDVQSGEVAAAASAPRFDLSLFTHHDKTAWETTLADKRQPFFPRFSRMTLPPGSVFKTLTAVACLQSGRWDPDQRVECQGFLDHPRSHRCYIFSHFGVGHYATDLTKALAQSCNVYFFTAARRIGPEPIYDWAGRFGFGQPTGIDLAGERGGNLPVPPGRQAAGAPRKPWFPGETLGLAIGQSSLTVTPLQVARMMAAVANGGQLVTPRLLRTPHELASSAVSVGKSQAILDLEPETLDRVREGLRQVVADSHGTGYKTVRLAEVDIAGKTGTAEVAGRPDHAWFAGYVPADRPRYAFVVVLEHAGSGSKAAGPVARALVQNLLRQGLLAPADLRAAAR